MTVRELKEKLEQLNIPDDATINCYCDHGQDTEKAYAIEFTRDKDDDPDACIWEFETSTKEDLKRCFNEELVDEYDFEAPIKQIVICADESVIL